MAPSPLPLCPPLNHQARFVGLTKPEIMKGKEELEITIQ